MSCLTHPSSFRVVALSRREAAVQDRSFVVLISEKALGAVGREHRQRPAGAQWQRSRLRGTRDRRRAARRPPRRAGQRAAQDVARAGRPRGLVAKANRPRLQPVHDSVGVRREPAPLRRAPRRMSSAVSTPLRPGRSNRITNSTRRWDPVRKNSRGFLESALEKRRVRFFCGGRPLFYAAEKPEKSAQSHSRWRMNSITSPKRT